MENATQELPVIEPRFVRHALASSIWALALLSAACPGEPAGDGDGEGDVTGDGDGDGDSAGDGDGDSAGDGDADEDAGAHVDAGPGEQDAGRSDAGSLDDGGALFPPGDGGSIDDDGGTLPDVTLCDVVDGLFATRCVSCHDGDYQFDLREDAARENLVNAPSTLYEGATLVIPGSPDESLLYQKIAGTHAPDQGGTMPPGSSVSSDALDLVYAWIEGGRQPSARPRPPPSSSISRPRTISAAWRWRSPGCDRPPSRLPR